MKKKNKIGIIGTGGIGGLLAILLSNNRNEVYCSNKKGDFGKFQLKLNSVYFGKKTKIINFTNKTFKNFDYIFICVKYYQLKSALKKIDYHTNKIIIPLLNGISHFELLKNKFKRKMIVSNIGKTISYKKNSMITHKSPNSPEIMMSSKNEKKIKDIIKILKSSKIKTIVNKSEDTVIWTKLIRISTLSAITSYYNKNLGQIKNNKKKEITLINILKEVTSLAIAQGLKINFKNLKNEIYRLPNNLTTSMQRDLWSGKISEIESILGGVLKEAKRHNIILKTTKKVYKSLKNNEKKNIRNYRH